MKKRKKLLNKYENMKNNIELKKININYDK